MIGPATYDHTPAKVVDHLAAIATELHTANLLAYLATLPADPVNPAQRNEVRQLVKTALFRERYGSE